MKTRYLALIMFIITNTKALTLSPTKVFQITHNNITHQLYEYDAHMGQLEDGTWVKLVCIKKGMIGMPNISMPSYRGQYINEQEERCYAFIAKPEGTITFNNKTLNVYLTEENKGFLSDGTKIRIECLPPGALAKISLTPEYRGTYYLEDASGDKNKRQQCHVYTADPAPVQPQTPQMRELQMKYRKPALSQIGKIGTGFR